MEGITQINQCLRTLSITESEVNKTYYLALLAEGYCSNSEIEEGLNVLAEAVTAAEKNKEHWYEAELLRLKGNLLLMQDGNTEEVEGWFRRSLELARRQNAISFELRTAISLCKLWQENDRSGEAQELLRNIYERFSEGFGTKDLQDARSLLEALQ